MPLTSSTVYFEKTLPTLEVIVQKAMKNTGLGLYLEDSRILLCNAPAVVVFIILTESNCYYISRFSSNIDLHYYLAMAIVNTLVQLGGVYRREVLDKVVEKTVPAWAKLLWETAKSLIPKHS